ncbi:hypothetical protein BN1723_009833, partial [Verticillium longisporum]
AATLPLPVLEEGGVQPRLEGDVLGANLLVAQGLPRGGTAVVQARDAVDGVDGEAEAVRLVADGQLEGRVNVALFLVAADVEVGGAGPLVGQAVDEPGVRVEVEYDGDVGGEEGGPLGVGEAVGVVRVVDELEEVDDVDAADLEVGEVRQQQVDGGEGLVGVEVEYDGDVVGEEGGPLGVGEAVGVVGVVDELEEVDDVDAADLEVGEVRHQQVDGGERLVGRDVAARGHDDVGLGAGVGAELRPDADALGAVLDGLVHGQVLQVVLLVGDDDVDVVGRGEAVVHDGQQAVAVGRQVDAHHVGRLVDDRVEEARVLVGEAVVVLAPDDGRQENVERGDLVAPLDLEALFEPLAVLVDHGADNGDEGLVRVEHAVAAREDVALEPALAGVLREHLHDAALHGEVAAVGVLVKVLAEPDLGRRLVHLAEL